MPTDNRPIFHFLPPSGSWINDPCAPFYDHATSTYHLFFQYNPKYNDWGEIAWGHAVSREGKRQLVDWEMTEGVILKPGPEGYDDKGIYTGGFIPHVTEEEGKRLLIMVYTSVNHLPFNYTLPYPYGCESLSLATSTNDGKTWQKHPSNPILPGPPTRDVTGWRDPYVAEWSEMDQILGNESGTSLYGIVAGGTHADGPNIFLYRIPRKNFAKWTYLGPLLPPLGKFFNLKNDRWSGDLGINMEVTNFFTLQDQSGEVPRTFLVFGSEGQKPLPSQEGNMLQRGNRGNVNSLWLSGSLRKTETGVKLDISSTGRSDYALAYALNGFHSPLHGHPITYPWVREDDLPNDLRAEQGWSGCIGLPRKMSMSVKRDVVGCLGEGLEALGGCWEVLQEKSFARATVITLGNEGVPGVLEALRASAHKVYEPDLNAVNESKAESAVPIVDNTTNAYILRSSVSFPVDNLGSAKAGFIIAHNRDQSIQTTLIFDPSTETFTIDRSDSLPTSMATSGIATQPEVIPHTLLRYRGAGREDVEQEPLDITIVVDKSVVEVFLNGRTAVTTRIYSGFAEGNSGLSVYREEGASFETIKVWDGLKCEVNMVA